MEWLRDSVYSVANYLSVDSKAPGLQPNKYQKYKLIKKINVTHNSRKFRFALQDQNTELGLPCGKHISFRFFETDPETKERDEIRRLYTPITSNRDKGYFDVVIKVYPHGKMSSYLDTLVPNKDHIEARGPMGEVEYLSPGLVTIKKKREYKVNKIGMICGGTGITPMLHIIDEIIYNNDPVQVSLVFGNVSMDDILMKPELEAIRRKYDNIQIRFMVDDAPTDGREWKEDVGYITSEIIKERIFPPAKDVIVFLCGPGRMRRIAHSSLLKLGHDENQVIMIK
eukprot:79295_1